MNKIILLIFVSNKLSKLFVDKKPPEEIIVIARLKELNDRILKIFNIQHLMDQLISTYTR